MTWFDVLIEDLERLKSNSIWYPRCEEAYERAVDDAIGVLNHYRKQNVEYSD